jgi:ATP-dependent DNA helicase RecQ
LHAALVTAGAAAERYHGRLSANARASAQDAFMENRVRVMVATNAFGMGIDKPDIRFVIHAQMPGSLDAYYQEAGRAGRDNEAARCTLLFEMKDKQVQQFFLGGRYPGMETLRRVAETVRTLARENESQALDKPLARLREALPNVGANKLSVAATLLHDIGMTRRTRRGGMKLIDDGKAIARLDDASQRYVAKAERDRFVLERMIAYAQSAQCRWRMLLDYFAADMDDARACGPLRSAQVNYRTPDDELDGQACGICDNCLHPPEVEHSPRELREEARATQAAEPKPSAPRFESGERVRVRRYGEGTVEMVSGERVAVRFADNELRTFIARYVRRVGVEAARKAR